MSNHVSVAEGVEPLADTALHMCHGNGVAAITLAALTLSYLIAACVHDGEVKDLVNDIKGNLLDDVLLFQRKLLEAVPHGTHIH